MFVKKNQKAFAIAVLMSVVGISAGDVFADEVARLSSVAITGDDVRAALIGQPPEVVNRIAESEISARNLATELLVRREVARQVQAQGMADDPVVQARMQQAQERVLYDSYMAGVEAAASAEDAIPALARDEYRANISRFQVGEQVQARHILFARGDDPNQALAEALTVRARLLAGEDFAQLAQSLSADKGSAQRGGDLGFFERGRMVPEFDTAAFALQVGEISDPIATQFGFHLIRVDARREAGVRPFEEVREELEKRVRQKLRSNARSAAVAPFATSPDLEIDVPALQQAVRGQTKP